LRSRFKTVTFCKQRFGVLLPASADFSPLAVDGLSRKFVSFIGPAQCSRFPSASGSQMVHNVPAPLDLTNPAMIVSTSDNSDPARINFRILRTDWLEKKPESFGARSG